MTAQSPTPEPIAPPVDDFDWTGSEAMAAAEAFCAALIGEWRWQQAQTSTEQASEQASEASQ